MIRLRRQLSELEERAELSELSARRLEAEVDSVQSQREQLQDAFRLESQELLAQTEVERTRLEKSSGPIPELRVAKSYRPIDGIVTALPFPAVVGQIADAGTVLAEVVPPRPNIKLKPDCARWTWVTSN